jgi:hypothetical protein
MAPRSEKLRIFLSKDRGKTGNKLMHWILLLGTRQSSELHSKSTALITAGEDLLHSVQMEHLLARTRKVEKSDADMDLSLSRANGLPERHSNREAEQSVFVHCRFIANRQKRKKLSDSPNSGKLRSPRTG